MRIQNEMILGVPPTVALLPSGQAAAGSAGASFFHSLRSFQNVYAAFRILNAWLTNTKAVPTYADTALKNTVAVPCGNDCRYHVFESYSKKCRNQLKNGSEFSSNQ